MRHKHAEVLEAISLGKDVEWFCNSVGKFTLMGKADQVNPIAYPHFDWRIKPEPKPDVVKHFKASIDLKYGDAIAHSVAEEWLHCSNMKLTFDGDTGALKSAEVIK
jgi:hemoglobin-like flavoprotein